MAGTAAYYVLCAEKEDGEEVIALLHLGDDEDGSRVLALAVYTSPDGEVQREHLDRFADKNEDRPAVISPMGRQELLDLINREIPNSVFIDGQKVAGSVFKARLKDELGIPLRRPRIIRPEPPGE